MSRVRLTDFEQQKWALSRSYLSMDAWRGESRDGHFFSPHGFVRVWMSRNPRWIRTALTFIHDGRTYDRRWKTLFGDRTIARLARELVEEVVGR